MKVIYPGTFDPFSMGHLDIVMRATGIFSEVVVAVSESQMKHPMYSMNDRIEMAHIAVEGIQGVSIKGFSGLLVDFMRENDVKYIIRGIRGMVDFEYEFQMAQVNRTMLSGFEPIFLMPSEKYMVLSSSIIREVGSMGGDLTDFLPKPVLDFIKNKQK